MCAALGFFSLNACAEKNNDIDAPEEPDTTASLEDVIKGELGTEFEVGRALVVGTNQQGLVLQKNGARIYAFYGESHDFKAGDVVTVTGATESRNGLVQFGKGCAIEKTGEKKVEYPEPAKFTANEINAYMSAPEIRYVTVEGTVMVAGNYANVEIEGTSVIGSLDYMSDEFKEKYHMHSVTLSGWLIGSYKTYMYMVPTDVKDAGEFEETVPDGAIYFNSFDKEIAVQDTEKYQTSKGWPFCEQFDGWKNEKGTGTANVTYDFQSISPRTNQSSKGDLSQYEGSGKNNLLFSTLPSYFTIENIAVDSRNLRLTFGAQRYSQGASNTFIKSDFRVYLSADGQEWSPAIDYDFDGVEDVPGNWRRAVADFTLPAGTTKLYIKFEAKFASTNRIDDVLLIAGNGGQEIEFGKVVETPLSTVAEVLAAPVDEEYMIEGLVIATHTKGFLVQDETGTILVFKGNNHGIVEGDKVTVKGPTSIYGEMKQFGQTSEVTKNGTGTVSHPKPVEFKGADFTSYATTPSIKYIQYTGALTSYQDNIWQWHYNVAVDGTEVVGSLAYPNGTLNVTSFVGRDVVVTGYAIAVSGSDTKYLNTLVTSIEFADKETVPDESAALTVKELNEKLASMNSGDALESLVAFKGYVAANNEGGALYQVISVTDNTGEAHSGIIIKGMDFTEKTLPVGTKVIVSLKHATYDLYNGLPQIKSVTIFPTYTKAEIVVPVISDAECGDHLGEYVEVRNLTAPENATTWVVGNKTTSTEFTGENGKKVTARITKYAVYKDETIAQRTASLKGVMEVYNGSYQIYPTSMDDVDGFKK